MFCVTAPEKMRVFFLKSSLILLLVRELGSGAGSWKFETFKGREKKNWEAGGCCRHELFSYLWPEVSGSDVRTHLLHPGWSWPACSPWWSGAGPGWWRAWQLFPALASLHRLWLAGAGALRIPGIWGVEGDEVNYLNFLSGTGDMWKKIFEPFLSLKKNFCFLFGRRLWNGMRKVAGMGGWEMEK